MKPPPLAMLPDLPRPADVTPYMWRVFLHSFAWGMRFWTSEDGDSGDIVIARLPNAGVVLLEEYPDVDWHGVTLRETYVDRVWFGRDWFDGPGYPGKPRRGRGWELSDEPTPFPVLAHDPHARIAR